MIDKHKTTICPNCLGALVYLSEYPEKPVKYCSFCGSSLTPLPDVSESSSASFIESSAAMVPGHFPIKSPIQFQIGPYQVLKRIGRGGMGEVFLAYDTACGRRMALKRIRPDLKEIKVLYNRFLKEARITSQLTHPAIIPIYSIHAEGDQLWYTMPYVEGETLKQFIRKAKKSEEKGVFFPHGAILPMARVFLSVCQAIAYAHSKGVLHRDIKPENIILGRYGEVLILDWGLSKLMDSPENEDELPENQDHPLHQLTHIGKVVGTLTYMAPERALGEKASPRTDVYSLGVILFQILTLHLPFKRPSLKEFRKQIPYEVLPEPEEIAPYRDVPKVLTEIVRKCLNPNPEERFKTVDMLIQELQNFIEGFSEWFESATLEIENKEDWEFQENVLIVEHTAITRYTEETDWVNLMISNRSFTGNTKIEGTVKLNEEGHGIGILLSIPEAVERERLNEGYCLWLSSEKYEETKLLRSAIEVYQSPDTVIKVGVWTKFRVEKIDHSIHVFLNDQLQFSYLSHAPLEGTHIGIMLRDNQFELEPIKVYEAGQNVMVNCLKVPDAFFAHRDYEKALSEYRRIGYSFPGRTEGREAILRAGVTLIEKGKNVHEQLEREKIFDEAFLEFEKLHYTPYAPFEYLGKSLVYQAEEEFEEEVKCLELALRRYRKHPLISHLQEEIISRLHESSSSHRLATYLFSLLVIRHLPRVAASSQTSKLFTKIQKHGEQLPFLEPLHKEHLDLLDFSLLIGYNVEKSYIIEEVITELAPLDPFPEKEMANALFTLIEMDKTKSARDLFEELKEFFSPHYKNSIEMALKEDLKSLISYTGHDFCYYRSLFYLLKQRIKREDRSTALSAIHEIKAKGLNPEFLNQLNTIELWVHLKNKDFDAAKEVFQTYPSQMLTQESSMFHFLFGVYLAAVEGTNKAKAHFQSVLDTSYPRSWNLASHFLAGKLDYIRWLKNAFFWEKKMLYKQLSLYYSCINDQERADYYKDLLEKKTGEEEG